MKNPLRVDVSSLTSALHKALCIQRFPSQTIERHNVPEVEVQDNFELLLPPIAVPLNDKEECLIESSINSARISFKLHPADALEAELLRMYMRFLMQRADGIHILRRVPVRGYDVSFLVTDVHCQELGQQCIVDFIIGFIQDVNSEVSSLKRAVHARGHAVATDILRSLAF